MIIKAGFKPSVKQSSKMKVLLFIVCASLVLLDTADSASTGGCLSKGTSIPLVTPSDFQDLTNRINEIKNGDTQTKKYFQNREGCLPEAVSYYSEYRLYPSTADANRIVMDEGDQTYYFTQDHYENFYEVWTY